MGIVRTVEWRITVPAEETWNRAFAAMTALDLSPESDSQRTLRGASKRSLTKNRCAAEVSLTVTRR
jgi:hypothetical protein